MLGFFVTLAFIWFSFDRVDRTTVLATTRFLIWTVRAILAATKDRGLFVHFDSYYNCKMVAWHELLIRLA